MYRWRVRDVDREAHLANIVLCHAACNITFVLEDQQRGSHKTLGDISDGVANKELGNGIPLGQAGL